MFLIIILICFVICFVYLYLSRNSNESSSIREIKTNNISLPLIDYTKNDNDNDIEAPKKKKEKFISSNTFSGKKEGYIFKMGKEGIGYYLDRHISFTHNDLLIYNSHETPIETGNRNRNKIV